MKKRQVQIIVGLLLCLVIALAVPQAAVAIGTNACTPIGNRADVQYNVGGFAQSPVSSNTNTFVVGNRVNHTVVTTDVSPGPSVVSNQTGAVLTFTITNNGNANQTYALTTVQLASALTGSVFSGNNTVNDAFDAASVTNVGVTSIVTANTSTTVTIISTIPLALTNDTYAVVALRAQALKVDGATAEANGSTSVTSAAGTCVADVVLGDPIGTDDLNMTNPDGYHSARSAYHAVLTNLTIAKSSVVYWDPINLLVGPKAIPSAIMEYVVRITNTGGSPATAVTLTDALTGTLTPVTVAWTSVTAGGVSGCAGKARANINNAGWVCLDVGFGGSSSWSGQTLTGTVDTLVSGATATVVYQATIN
jgi:uncharacterized repeat protein (TIGR01451 family)